MANSANNNELKALVRDFWDAGACGEIYGEGDSPQERFSAHARARYQLEPYISQFAQFSDGRDKDVLEIGVGMGADHVEWAKAAPRTLSGIDLTPRAIELTRSRLEANSLKSHLQVADAESLPFEDKSFDLVYSWGVLHHSPDTTRAISEAHRVLRPGGTARIMIYHRHSIVGYMLWIRYALLAAKPTTTLDDIYAAHLESPGTKAYSVTEAKRMCSAFRDVQARAQLSFGDLLEGAAGQRHRGFVLTMARSFWPRTLLKRVARTHGLYLLIEAKK